MKSKKANVGKLSVLIAVTVVLVVAIVVMTFSSQIVGDVRDDMGESTCAKRSDTYTLYNTTSLTCTNSSGADLAGSAADYEYNVTVDGLSAYDNISSKLPTLGTIVIAVLIIGLLVGGFAIYARMRT